MRPISALLCIVTAAQLVACDYVQKQASSLSRHDVKSQPTIAIPAGDPDEILQKAFEAQLQVSSLRVRHTDVNRRAKLVVITEWIPGRTHTILVENIPNSDPPPETVEIGPKTYKKLTIGFWSVWREMNYAGRVTNQPNILRDIAKFKEMKNGMFLGVEELDGAQTLLYKAGQDSLPGRPVGYGYYVKIWIGADGLPRQVEGLSEDWKVTETYFDYNANIDIQAPR